MQHLTASPRAWTRALIVTATLLAVLAMLTATAPAANAAYDGEWSCSVPYGWTYDAMSGSYSCTSWGYAPKYHLRIPTDGLWACTTSGMWTGMTYDAVTSTSWCSLYGTSTYYHMRRPVRGMWACAVPTGFSWDATMTSNSCSTWGTSTIYHLR